MFWWGSRGTMDVRTTTPPISKRMAFGGFDEEDMLDGD